MKLAFSNTLALAAITKTDILRIGAPIDRNWTILELRANSDNPNPCLAEVTVNGRVIFLSDGSQYNNPQVLPQPVEPGANILVSITPRNAGAGVYSATLIINEYV